jgi:predicted MFS family arabinose efflux permease
VRVSQLKLGYFTLEAINSFAATFYLYYLFFLMRDEFGFQARDNLWLTAAHGFVYLLASWQGGKFIQRRGCFAALKLGFAGMGGGLLLGCLIPGVTGQMLAVLAWTVPLCLIWPALETLVTEGEDYAGTARMVGRYNVVWASTNALAFFSGGWLWQQWGRTGLYGICLTLIVSQFLLTLWLERQARRVAPANQSTALAAHQPEAAAFRQAISPKGFLHLAWLANPFAYVAINTLAANIPQLAEKFSLSPAQAGMFCSLWFFARMMAFIGLWRWTGWHYRFRWLLAGYLTLLVGFMLIMLAPQLWLVLVAQVIFGAAIGLMYYSSLFYAMDLGESKGEHGGLHEAAIGLGVCIGPAVGAAALQLAPRMAYAGVWAVSALLCVGLAGLLGLRLKNRQPPPFRL